MNGTELLDLLRDAATLYDAQGIPDLPPIPCGVPFCAAAQLARQSLGQSALGGRMAELCAAAEGRYCAERNLCAVLFADHAENALPDELSRALRRAWTDRYGAAEDG